MIVVLSIGNTRKKHKERRKQCDHVLLGNALSDADDERNLCVHGLVDGGGGCRSRHVDDGSVGASLGASLCKRKILNTSQFNTTIHPNRVQYAKQFFAADPD